MTSLTPNEARVVHELNFFASHTPYYLPKDSRELIRQLYRFNHFYPSKEECVKIPRTWYCDYQESEGTLQTTVRNVREWFTRPDALKTPETPPRPLSPNPLSQPQSPLYSVLPTEIREYIFKLVVTSYPEGEDDRYHYPNTTPAITSVCRLVRQEMLRLFFKHNHFAFPTDSKFSRNDSEYPTHWLHGMRQHLTKIHQITFFVNYLAIDDEDPTFDEGPTFEDISVTIRHDPARDCWTTTCEDDWSLARFNNTERTPDERKALERDGNMLCGIMRTMVDGRSRADLSPEYLLWLMHDAATFYTIEKLKGDSNLACGLGIWNFSCITARPRVMRPPDMYSTDIGYDQMARFHNA